MLTQLQSAQTASGNLLLFKMVPELRTQWISHQNSPQDQG